MRYFKIPITKDIEATIQIHPQHLEIYKRILRIKTDRGFRNSMRHWVDVDLKGGQNPFVTKALLEHNLPYVLASEASGHLHSLFGELEDDTPEGTDVMPENTPSNMSTNEKIIPFSMKATDDCA